MTWLLILVLPLFIGVGRIGNPSVACKPWRADGVTACRFNPRISISRRALAPGFSKNQRKPDASALRLMEFAVPGTEIDRPVSHWLWHGVARQTNPLSSPFLSRISKRHAFERVPLSAATPLDLRRGLASVVLLERACDRRVGLWTDVTRYPSDIRRASQPVDDRAIGLGRAGKPILRRGWQLTTANPQSASEFFQQFLNHFGPSGDWEHRSSVDPDTVERAARSVFETPEFRELPHLDLKEGASVESQKSEPPQEWKSSTPQKEGDAISPLAGLAAFLSNLFGSLSAVVIGAAIVLIAVGIAATIFYVSKMWREQEESAAGEDDATDDPEADRLASPGDRPPDVWLEAARRAAAAGRFDEAVSCLLLGAMGHAERAGLIQPRRGLTYRDYLRVVPRGSAWHPALQRLIRTYAPIGFGRREGTAQAFNEVLGPYETALAAEPTSENA